MNNFIHNIFGLLKNDKKDRDSGFDKKNTFLIRSSQQTLKNSLGSKNLINVYGQKGAGKKINLQQSIQNSDKAIFVSIRDIKGIDDLNTNILKALGLSSSLDFQSSLAHLHNKVVILEGLTYRNSEFITIERLEDISSSMTNNGKLIITSELKITDIFGEKEFLNNVEVIEIEPFTVNEFKMLYTNHGLKIPSDIEEVHKLCIGNPQIILNVISEFKFQNCKKLNYDYLIKSNTFKSSLNGYFANCVKNIKEQDCLALSNANETSKLEKIELFKSLFICDEAGQLSESYKFALCHGFKLNCTQSIAQKQKSNYDDLFDKEQVSDIGKYFTLDKDFTNRFGVVFSIFVVAAIAQWFTRYIMRYETKFFITQIVVALSLVLYLVLLGFKYKQNSIKEFFTIKTMQILLLVFLYLSFSLIFVNNTVFEPAKILLYNKFEINDKKVIEVGVAMPRLISKAYGSKYELHINNNSVFCIKEPKIYSKNDLVTKVKFQKLQISECLEGSGYFDIGNIIYSRVSEALENSVQYKTKQSFFFAGVLEVDQVQLGDKFDYALRDILNSNETYLEYINATDKSMDANDKQGDNNISITGGLNSGKVSLSQYKSLIENHKTIKKIKTRLIMPLYYLKNYNIDSVEETKKGYSCNFESSYLADIDRFVRKNWQWLYSIMGGYLIILIRNTIKQYIHKQ
ncbi:MAG: hypothetical protein C0602_11450 [Denitrovibrio sp.]|nr:MAG: hypothetical protein C0602_11450 [Denitrovibrio sp.]